MKQHPEPIVSVAIFLALLGLVLAVPSLFVRSPILLWAACACGGVALLLGLMRSFIWCSQNLNFRQWVIATVASLLMPIALIAGLRWMEPAGPPPAADEADATAIADVPEVVDAATVALMTEALSQTRPGYTSETLMQVPRGGGLPSDLKYNDLVFRDSTGDGASIDLTSVEEDRLVVAATARDGGRRELVLPLGRGGVPTDRNISLAVEAGNRPAGAYMRALVDGKEVAARGFADAIDFGDRQWKAGAAAGSGKMMGVKVVRSHRFVAPWALSSPKLAELVATTRAELRAFFAGDDTLLYPLQGDGPIGPSPLAGTFMLPTLPPE